LSTPALDAVIVAAIVFVVFDMVITEGAIALRGTLVPGAMPAFDACVAWVALARKIFDGETLAPFGATDTFAGTAFRPDTFVHFLEGSAPASLFLFFVASLHSSDSSTNLLKNPVHPTSIRHHFNTSFMLTASIPVNNVSRVQLHPRLKTIIHFL
jgi:hypothetical protein